MSVIINPCSIEHLPFLGTYLVQIGRQNLSEQDSHVVSELLHIVGDIERISGL